MSFWQQYVIVPGILSFLAVCKIKKASLAASVLAVIAQVRDACIEIVGLPQ